MLRRKPTITKQKLPVCYFFLLLITDEFLEDWTTFSVDDLGLIPIYDVVERDSMICDC